MQAIETRYMPPTNHLGARIKATTASGKTLTIPFPYELSGESVHWEAAKELAESLGWHGDYVAGSTRDGYVFVRLISNGNTPANVFRVHEETCA